MNLFLFFNFVDLGYLLLFATLTLLLDLFGRLKGSLGFSFI